MSLQAYRRINVYRSAWYTDYVAVSIWCIIWILTADSLQISKKCYRFTTVLSFWWKISCSVLFGKGCKRDDPSLMLLRTLELRTCVMLTNPKYPLVFASPPGDTINAFICKIAFYQQYTYSFWQTWHWLILWVHNSKKIWASCSYML